MKDSKLNNDLENVVQLRPQNIRVKLRVGVPHEFKVEFQRAKGYPIDLYYLMDLSYSMKDDLEKIKNLGQDILDTLQKITQTVRIGFGSFVDKEMLPYVSQVGPRRRNPCPNRMDTCQPAFTFHNVLPLTNIPEEFKREVSKQKISGNLDSPEAGLDAIMQATVCQKEIKWGNVTRILVYTSDDTFHMAGDGRLAGIFRPHDGQCHLQEDGSYDGKAFDYPTIGQLSRLLQSNNIQLIFAVTEKSIPAYQALSSLIPQSVVGVLKDDSSNVVQLINEAYRNLSSTLLLEQDQSPAGLHVSYLSDCKDGASRSWQHRGECSGIGVNKQVDFTVRLTASECLKEPETFKIQMQGISEVLKVTVETLCDCQCGAAEEDSQYCKERGTLSCGVCSCNEGYQGQRCECESNITKTNSDILTSCRQSNSLQVCSGHGNCECGQCVCSRQFYGNFCECDDSSCERNDNKICNGQGSCKCGTCVCNANYNGSACQCPVSTDMCHRKGDVFCNGLGDCECNRCVCRKGFSGEDCSNIIDPCEPYRSCVEREVKNRISGQGSLNTCSADKHVHTVKHVWLEGCDQLKCIFKDGISYEVTLKDAEGVLIKYVECAHTIDKTKVIIGTSVTSIIVIGIVIIIVYRILLEIYDRREYQHFVKAQQEANWNTTPNPLFKGATTTTLNPLHIQDG
ncbi:integrin beta-7 isoform X2 [Brachyhypopomus gauderio]